jgi:Protein of unknown function (DUF2934)
MLVANVHAERAGPCAREEKMEQVFDIFARLPDGSAMWIESVPSLDQAHQRVRELVVVAPRDYFIYSERSGIIESVNLTIAERSVETTARSAKWRALRYPDYMQAREERISALAHCYWLLRGCPDGSPEVDWFQAESEFDQAFVEQLELGIPA